MNRKELILDFLTWFIRHKEDIFDLVDHPEATVDEYIEMLDAVEGLSDDLPMKTWCIEFERELEGKDVIHVDSEKEPTKAEAIEYIKEEGYRFNEKYDQVIEIYEV